MLFSDFRPKSRPTACSARLRCTELHLQCSPGEHRFTRLHRGCPRRTCLPSRLEWRPWQRIRMQPPPFHLPTCLNLTMLPRCLPHASSLITWYKGRTNLSRHFFIDLPFNCFRLFSIFLASSLCAVFTFVTFSLAMIR